MLLSAGRPPRALALFSAAFASMVTPACGNGTDCGPGDATGPVTGTVGGADISYAEFRSSANNDCSEPDGPVSLTLEATQSGTDRLLVFCLPRPDRLDGETVELDDASLVQVVAAFADVDGCAMALDRARALAGTMTFSGVCADGTDEAGYAITFDATLPVTITCSTDGGQDVREASLSLSGDAPVTATQP